MAITNLLSVIWTALYEYISYVNELNINTPYIDNIMLTHTFKELSHTL